MTNKPLQFILYTANLVNSDTHILRWSKEGAKHHTRALPLIPLRFLEIALIHSPGGRMEIASVFVCVCGGFKEDCLQSHSLNYLWSEMSFGWDSFGDVLPLLSEAIVWCRLISASPELLANNTALSEKRLLTTEHLLRRNDLLICWRVENQTEAGAWYIGEICRGGRSVHEIELRQTYSWGRTDAEVFMRWTWSGNGHKRGTRCQNWIENPFKVPEFELHLNCGAAANKMQNCSSNLNASKNYNLKFKEVYSP